MKRFFNTTTFFSLAGIAVACLTAGLALGDDGEDKGRESVQAASATVTMEQAIQTAKAKFPGRVVESELESEDGALVYEVKIVSASGKAQEIEIDAQSGEILGSEIEHEDEEDDDDAHESEKS